jgi:large subunit ribosomal protein L5
MAKTKDNKVAKEPKEKPDAAAPKAPPAPKVPEAPVVARLQERYAKEIVPELKKKLKKDNVFALPKLHKIVLNMGLSRALDDKTKMEQAVANLTQIAGQKAVVTHAKKAISNFRLRIGNPIGARVTLRGKRMYEFLDRLISIALPRIRDFRGVDPKSFDGNGNFNLGLTEQTVFPEIDPDKVTFTQGMDIAFVTNSGSDDESRELLKSFGVPFRTP